MDSPLVPRARPVLPGMRRLLFVASGLVFVVGIQLFILTKHTDRFFAWTVESSMTAASLGAAYWASFVLEFLSARERVWARARIAVPAVLIFTTLTLVTTLLNLDDLHLRRPSGASTIAATWIWVVVYVAVPPAMLILLIAQLRAPGGDPPREVALAAWVRALFSLQGIAMIALGALFFIAPLRLAPLWPWTLSDFTGRAVGAWLLGLGVAVAHIAWENDALRSRSAAIGICVLCALELLALARYPGELDWGGARAWIYLLFLASLLVSGVAGLIPALRATDRPGQRREG